MRNIKAIHFSLFDIYRGLPRGIYILFIGKMINCIGAFVHPLLTLILTQKIGLPVAKAGLIISIAGLCQAPCLLIGGKLVDCIGRKKIILTCQSASAFCYILCAVIAPSVNLTYFLILASCLSCMAQPAYDSIVGDITTPENRQASFSLVYMGLNLGFSIGPLLGGFLFENHLRLLFIGDALTTLISTFLIVTFIKETHSYVDKTTPVTTYELEKAETGSIFKVFAERPLLICFSLLHAIFSFTYAQWNFTVPLRLGELFTTKSASYFGMLSSCNGFLCIVLTPFLIAATKRFKIIHVMASAGFLYAIAFTLCAFNTSLVGFFAVISLITLGEVCMAINVSTFVTNITPSSHRGRMNSVLPLINGSGHTLAPLIMGQLISIYGMQISLLMIVGLVVIAASLMYNLKIDHIKKSH